MSWQTFDRSGAIDSVRFSNPSYPQLLVSRALGELVGTPRYVELLYDTDARRIGLRPQAQPSQSEYRFSSMKTGQRRVSMSGLFSRLGIKLVEPVSCPAWVEDGMLVVDISPLLDTATS